jgi:hypothetical protein
VTGLAVLNRGNDDEPRVRQHIQGATVDRGGRRADSSGGCTVQCGRPPSVSTADQAPESFEVASIRRNTSQSTGGVFRAQPGGRFVAVNATLRDLVRYAFAL